MNRSLDNTSREDAKKAAEIIRNGGVILCPTDTVWGLSCDATNPEAVQKVFQLKGRDKDKGLIVLIARENDFDRFAAGVPEVAFELIEASDQPLTLVLDGARGVAEGVASPDGSIALRLCEDHFCAEIIKIAGKPLVSTSANLSGQPAPGLFDEIGEDIKSKVDYICQHRQDDKRKSRPSAIISLGSGGQIKVIRK